MNLTNSYIFLKSPDKKDFQVKNSDGKEIIHIDIDSVMLQIEKLFNITSNNKNKSSWYIHCYNFSIEDCNVEIKIHEIKNITYVDVISTAKTKTQIIKSLEQIHDKISESDIQKKYIMIVSYDAISEHYCNKIYPKLNEFERNLRHLLSKIYTLNFGIEYYNTTVNKDLRAKAKESLKAKGSPSKKRIEMTKKFFYNLNYSGIQSLLFTKQLTQIEEKAINEFISNLKPDDKFTGKEIRDIIESFVPKSDWERLFKSKIPDDIEKMIDDVRNYRNSIMHCKFFFKDDYNQCKKLIAKLNRKVLKAIDITTNEDFAEKNWQELMACIPNITETFEKFYEIMANAGKKLVQINQKLAPLFENKTWETNNMFKGIAEIVSKLSNINFSMPKLFLPLIYNQTNDDTNL
ncbi:MAG: hypothetical protein IJG00_01390 [Clostridia bacterium]|nr:hypothetical protein [Clostridia bacterium]